MHMVEATKWDILANQPRHSSVKITYGSENIGPCSQHQIFNIETFIWHMSNIDISRTKEQSRYMALIDQQAQIRTIRSSHDLRLAAHQIIYALLAQGGQRMVQCNLSRLKLASTPCNLPWMIAQPVICFSQVLQRLLKLRAHSLRRLTHGHANTPLKEQLFWHR